MKMEHMEYGGIFGYSYYEGTKEISVEECYNKGTIINTGSAGSIGGIVGRAETWYGETTKIVNCYNVGKIVGDLAYGGGIVGNKAVDINSSKLIVENCYNIGQFKLENTSGKTRYSICGSGVKNNNFYLKGCGATDVSNTTEITSEELQSEQFVEQLGKDKWKMSKLDYPILMWEEE